MCIRDRDIRTLPKPVVAMVAGYAIGGGHVLHLICDLSIAADNARFGQTGPRVGSFDGGFGAGLLARTVGLKKAKEIWFLCRQYDAQEALAMGLVNTVVPLADLETDDGVFRGFPAGWNLVANSLWVVVLQGWASVAICLLFVALTFSNLPIAHPVQSRVYQPLTTIITATWMGVLIHMTVLGRGEAPIGEQWLLVILPAWWLIIGYVRSTRLRREATPHSV